VVRIQDPEIVEHHISSDATDEVCERNLQGRGDPDQSVQRYIFLSALNLPHVLVAKVCHLRQLLLAQASLLAIIADVLANGSTMRMRHKSSRKQEVAFSETRYMCYFLLAPFGNIEYNWLKSDMKRSRRAFENRMMTGVESK
jgi:hypothetical protein